MSRFYTEKSVEGEKQFKYCLKKSQFINNNDHTCMNGFSNWLPDALSATNFLGQKLDGNEDNIQLLQTSNLSPLGRYLSCPQLCTLSIISNLRFFILKNCASNFTFVGVGEYNIIP